MLRVKNSSIVAAAFAVGIISAAAYMQGRLSNRWGTNAPLAASSVNLLTQIPRDFGDWKFQEDLPLSAAVQDVLQCASHVNYVFVNKISGEQIGATVLLGPSGPLTVHTPEICLSAADYTQVGKSQIVALNHDDRYLGTFYRAIFRSQSPNVPSLEIFWGWNDGTGWNAPDNPRLNYGGVAALYKLQVAAQLWPNVAEGEEGTAAQFVRSFLLSAPPFRFEASDSISP